MAPPGVSALLVTRHDRVARVVLEGHQALREGVAVQPQRALENAAPRRRAGCGASVESVRGGGLTNLEPSQTRSRTKRSWMLRVGSSRLPAYCVRLGIAAGPLGRRAHGAHMRAATLSLRSVSLASARPRGAASTDEAGKAPGKAPPIESEHCRRVRVASGWVKQGDRPPLRVQSERARGLLHARDRAQDRGA